MKCFGVLLAVLVAANVAHCDRHKIVQKSLQGANRECDLYSGDSECLARCVTLITRDWNETVGLSPVYDRFFRPDANDRCYSNRTQRCLQELESSVAPAEKCQRASGAVQCYLDQYGEVDMATPRFVRSSLARQWQIVKECGAMLGYSPEQTNFYVEDTEYLLQETRCLFRCYLIRSGMYSEPDGLNMERFYVACGGYKEEFYQEVLQCAERVRSSTRCDDRCTLAQRLTTECIGSQYNQLLNPGPAILSADRGATVVYMVAQNQGTNITNVYNLSQG